MVFSVQNEKYLPWKPSRQGLPEVGFLVNGSTPEMILSVGNYFQKSLPPAARGLSHTDPRSGAFMVPRIPYWCLFYLWFNVLGRYSLLFSKVMQPPPPSKKIPAYALDNKKNECMENKKINFWFIHFLMETVIRIYASRIYSYAARIYAYKYYRYTNDYDMTNTYLYTYYEIYGFTLLY